MVNVLEINGLTVDVPGRRVVDGLSLAVPAGRVVALVGPSGCGKSLTARSVVRLHDPGAGVRLGGTILLNGTDVLALARRELRGIRGRGVGYAFQDAAASLNPTVTIGRHLVETVAAHDAGDPRTLGAAALKRCGLPTEDVWDVRPYELSGGQAQRAALAVATVLEPDLLIADEVTTALDPVTQAEVLDAVRAQAAEQGRAVLLITHDLAVAGRWADEIAVLSGGRVVEHGPSTAVLDAPRAEFTRTLVAAARLADRNDPDRNDSVSPVPGDPLLSLRGARRVLKGRGRTTVALNGVDLDVRPGEAVAVVGRSGSGKSTLVGTLAALDRPVAGRVFADGRDVWGLRERERRALRRRGGLVFQDALASFDPRYTVAQVVAEALRSRESVDALLERVGLDPAMGERRPATLSGGERQRVAIARALAAGPAVLLADEPTTGLDVLAQERILALLAGLRRDEGLAIVFVTHDLRVARRIADRVVVLAEGAVVEDVPVTGLDFAIHPETRALLATTPLLAAANELDVANGGQRAPHGS
ncbi:ABC transporter ATP-binding protein [Actinomadura rudentiformis]|uniref:ABC transporter ATP-binding protein n=1 Tax=Actinomadura rudentiformis TaxID=359158 RepID=A0A6H9YT99_9ACTN|nr:ABC transporter ATP-binding protein [Actinomadura rudentiformis]KAB2347390.1 ABC transporter ATP-binding protein [Actinomadura rudentiformis]